MEVKIQDTVLNELLTVGETMLTKAKAEGMVLGGVTAKKAGPLHVRLEKALAVGRAELTKAKRSGASDETKPVDEAATT